MAMNLSLSKMPWYGQLGAFAALSLAGVGVFWNLVREDRCRRHRRSAGAAGDACAPTSTRGLAPRAPAGVPPRGRGRSKRSSIGCAPVLPEEKDVADLLRRIQAMATQSNLAIRGFTPQAVATKQMHAEWPIGLKLDGTITTSARSSSGSASSRASSTSATSRSKRATARRRRRRSCRVHCDHVRAARCQGAGSSDGQAPVRRTGCGAAGAERKVTVVMRALTLTLSC